MPTALLISPHLDDAVFSCGASVALLIERGWDLCVATAFTKSRHPAAGFALENQRDKGLADDVDYMALRRDEDAEALTRLGAEARHLDLPEAPMRGYETADALFGDYLATDHIDPALQDAIDDLIEELRPNLLMGPSALGGHVDHRRVLDALFETTGDHATAFWRDVPYVIRHPHAALDTRLGVLDEFAVTVDGALDRKVEAAALYVSQLQFQFGGRDAMAKALTDLAHAEGAGVPVERFHGTPAGLRAMQP